MNRKRPEPDLEASLDFGAAFDYVAKKQAELAERCPIFDACQIKEKPQAFNCLRNGKCFGKRIEGS